jgi:succinoglycan biosynthesis transport protein ExoP
MSKELTVNSWSEPVMKLPPMREEKDLTIKDLWSLLLRRRGILFGTILVLFSMAVAVCVFSTRRYLATGAIQVQKDSSDALGLESMMGEAESTSDALDANVTIQTQANILQSGTLALKVINDLHLEKTQDFRSHFSPVGWALGLISPKGPPDPKHVSLEEAPGRRTNAVIVFSKNLKVKPVAGTRLIELSYLNPDPKIAAAVVNHLAQGLADYNFQTRYNATSQAAEWLGGQLSDLRKQSEDLQAKVVALQRGSGVFSLGETDTQGREQVYSTALDKLEQSTAQLTQAESNRVLKGAVYQVVKTGDPEMISGLAGAATVSATSSSGVSSSLSLIQNLRMQEATQEAIVEQMQAKFGPAYPKVAEARGNLAGLQGSIRAEVKRVAERAKNDYTVAQQVENSARSIFNQQKREADALNNKAIEYMIARQEADQSRTLYENLLNKLKEAGVLAGLHSSNITIVDPAREPSRPAKPNVLLYLAASLAGGVFLGSCGAFLRDAMDAKIQSLPDLEAYLGESPFGILPYHREPKRRFGEGARWYPAEKLPSGAAALQRLESLQQRGDLLDFPVLGQPRSPYSEALRALRTSLLLSKGGAPPQVILVTSSVAAEGKSMLSMNLACLLAQQGKKVLLVDADLRRPVLHRRMKVKSEHGLSAILTERGIEETALTSPVPTEQLEGLDLLPAGPVPPYPAELLGSEQMKIAIELWRTAYHFIVIDGAPVLPVTDSVLLSTMADLTILVARYKLTERQSLERSYRLLRNQIGRQQVGVVLNAVERNASSYYEYYGYRDSGYYGDEQGAVGRNG